MLNKINKLIPLFLAILAVLVSIAIRIKHESQLKDSQALYIKLLPVDPRSLLQGDYMRLRYELYLGSENWGLENRSATQPNADTQQQQQLREQTESIIKNQHKLLAYVQLDDRQILTSSNLLNKTDTHTQPIIIKNPSNRVNDLYIASKTFMFAEGLADCYDNAKYAKIMVDKQGNAILHSLVGEKLLPLHCEEQTSWRKPSNND